MAEDRELEGRELPAWAQNDEAHPEREAEWRALLAEIDALRADLARVTGERDEAIAKIGDVRASISAHKVRVATDERDASDERAQLAEKELDDARAHLAALHAAAARWNAVECDVVAGVYASAGSGEGHAVTMAAEASAACDALIDVCDDLAAAAKAHDEETAARAVAGVTEERDTLAAALTEVREKAQRVLTHRAVNFGAWEDLEDALSALPADLAAQRDARVRAEALRALIPPYDVMSDVDITEWLADEAERGGR